MVQTIDVYIVADKPTGDFNVSYFSTLKEPRGVRVLCKYPGVPEDQLPAIREVCRSSKRKPEEDVVQQIRQVVRV